MRHVSLRPGVLAIAMLLTPAWEHVSQGAGAARDDKDRKPSLSLSVNPNMASTPARIRVRVDVRGGADDYQDFYCPEIGWDWGDDTKSQATRDCDPYEPGRSTIERRYSTEHTYRQPGQFRVTFRMKQGNRVVGLAVGTVQIQAGLGRYD